MGIVFHLIFSFFPFFLPIPSFNLPQLPFTISFFPPLFTMPLSDQKRWNWDPLLPKISFKF